MILRAIHKQELPMPGQRRTYFIPDAGKIVHVAFQYGMAHVWYELPINDPTVQWDIYCIGTGHRVPGDDAVYFGTLIDDAGYVWHYYAVKQS